MVVKLVQVGGQVGGDVDCHRQKEVYDLIVANQKVSISQFAEKLGINKSAAQEHIDVLKAKEAIERQGGPEVLGL